MHKLKLPAIVLFLVAAILTILSCDDRNIVEPRFYDADLVAEFDGQVLRFGLPFECNVYLFLIGSAGEVVKVFYDGDLMAAGGYQVDFDWRDDNGHKLPDGVYCLLLLAGDYRKMTCFEYDDPEDYLP